MFRIHIYIVIVPLSTLLKIPDSYGVTSWQFSFKLSFEFIGFLNHDESVPHIFLNFSSLANGYVYSFAKFTAYSWNWLHDTIIFLFATNTLLAVSSKMIFSVVLQQISRTNMPSSKIFLFFYLVFHMGKLMFTCLNIYHLSLSR